MRWIYHLPIRMDLLYWRKIYAGGHKFVFWLSLVGPIIVYSPQPPTRRFPNPPATSQFEHPLLATSATTVEIVECYQEPTKLT